MRDDRPSYSAVLRRLRAKAGYASARDFHRSNGGRAFFGCGYEQYAHVEAGRSAPGPALAEKAAIALRVDRSPAEARAYFAAYLRAALKGERLVEAILAAFAARPLGEEQSPLRRALRRNYDEREVRLSAAQAAAIRADDASFHAWSLLSCDDRPWEERALAEAVGLGVPAVKRALARLARAGLVARGRDGRWAVKRAGRIHSLPRREAFRPDDLPRALARYDALERERGETEMFEGLLLRANPGSLRHFFPYLSQAVLGAGVYAADEPGERSLYLVEGRVRRLTDLPEGR